MNDKQIAKKLLDLYFDMMCTAGNPFISSEGKHQLYAWANKFRYMDLSCYTDKKIIAQYLIKTRDDMDDKSDNPFIGERGSDQLRIWANELLELVKHLDKETWDKWHEYRSSKK